MSKKLLQNITFNIFRAISYSIVAIVVVVLGFILFNGIQKLNWEFISSMPENGMMEGGIFPAILGTLVLIIGTSIIAFPVGVLAGVFMNEYAGENIFKKFVNLMTNNLAGVPSIVFGLFGLAVFVNFFGFGISIISGCLTLAILILPVIIRTTDESLKLVEPTVRNASYALGASKFQTVFVVVLPMAFENIITGLILSIGRVAGETAPIIFTVVAYYLPEIVFSLKSPLMALPYHLYVMSTSGIDLVKSREIAFGTALVLMIIVLTLNLLAGGVKIYLSKRK